MEHFCTAEDLFLERCVWPCALKSVASKCNTSHGTGGVNVHHTAVSLLNTPNNKKHTDFSVQKQWEC